MAEQTLPQTWDELKKTDGFDAIPDLKTAGEFTVEESARFAIASSGAGKRLEQMGKLGVWTKKTYDVEEATVLGAETIAYLDGFFKSISPAPERWDEWTKGRSVGDLLNLLVTLMFFYQDQLGKSSASKTPSATAE